jgi:hypothetical protein
MKAVSRGYFGADQKNKLFPLSISTFSKFQVLHFDPLFSLLLLLFFDLVTLKEYRIGCSRNRNKGILAKKNLMNWNFQTFFANNFEWQKNKTSNNRSKNVGNFKTVNGIYCWELLC